MFYGKFVESIFKPDANRATLPTPRRWSRFCSHGQQFLDSSLNIAGVGPIFGPILGALYTDGSFSLDSLCHFCGRSSRLFDGNDLHEVWWRSFACISFIILGKYFSHVVNFFTVLLLLLVGTVLFLHQQV
jgi:carbon starvation protein CstA